MENTANMDLKLYRVPELAQILDLTERSVVGYCERQVLKAVKIGGRWAVSHKNLQAYINGEQ